MKDEYADVSFNNVVSADPKDIDRSSLGFLNSQFFEKSIIFFKPKFIILTVIKFLDFQAQLSL